MPYESEAQRRFFRMCKHNPRHARGKCPGDNTIRKYEHDEKAKAQKKGVER